jgi:hypothetical protein
MSSQFHLKMSPKAVYFDFGNDAYRNPHGVADQVSLAVAARRGRTTAANSAEVAGEVASRRSLRFCLG